MSTTDKTAAGGTGAGRDNDKLLDQIDDVTRPGGDVDPDSLEAKLRLLLPSHTYFKRGDRGQVPPAISAIAERLGAQLVGGPPPDSGEDISALWSTPTGAWLVKTHTHGRPGARTYHVAIDGPDTEISRDDLTPDQVVDLLRAVGAIPSSS